MESAEARVTLLYLIQLCPPARPTLFVTVCQQLPLDNEDVAVQHDRRADSEYLQDGSQALSALCNKRDGSLSGCT